MMKMTKAERITVALNVLASVEPTDEILCAINGFNHDLEILSNRKSSPRKPSAAQLENARLRDELMSFFEACDKPVSISAIKASLAGFEDFTSSKISALIKPLRDAGKVKRTYIKKVAHFELGTEISE